jgi:penicillin amidase
VKYAKFLSAFFATAALIYVLDRPLGPAPALGRFLSPFTGFWQNAESVSGFKDQTYNMEGLNDKVEVIYDQRLVPHIFAQNDEDLFFMQGYITAANRLWQMEIQTHNAAGRVSEIVGEKALENDRLQRRIGLGFGAERAEEFIDNDPESKAILRAYCNGINAYIKSLSPKDYPLEYKLLGYAPEAWTPVKVALLLKNMSNMLSVFEFDVENTNFISKYGEEAFKYLYKDQDNFNEFIIPKGTKWDFEADPAFVKGTAEKSILRKITIGAKDQAPYESYNRVLEKPDDITGSNNWAVSGTKTKSGLPLLCNDPHLQLNLPSIWYEMHLVAPGINVYGATLPGAPCVISGFNDSIAWGVTNAGRDVRDWFKIQFRDESFNEYLVDGKWEKATKRAEIIGVKNNKPFIDTVIYTRYGPVVFDPTFKKTSSKSLLSLKWTAHLPSNEFKTFFKLNKGKNYDDYRAALKDYVCPAQNFVFASRANEIAIVEQGTFPNVAEEVVDGAESKNDWSAFIPVEHNPSHRNPERGFVSSANQFPVDETYPYPVSKVGVYENFRSIRINKMLSKAEKMDAEYMKEMHSDNYNVFAEMLVPTIVAVADASGKLNEYSSLINSLRNWNLRNDANLKEPVFFELWSTEMMDLLWDEMADPEVPMKRPNSYLTANFLKNDSTSIFYDNLQTGEREDRESIILQAFSRAVTKLKEQYGSLDKIHDWGTHKATYVHHLAKLDPLSKLNVYCGGNRGIINATSATHGPSWKMVVDFGDSKAYCVYPGGESGNPGSKFYDNMIDTWAKGQYYTVELSNDIEKIRKTSLFQSTFNKK